MYPGSDLYQAFTWASLEVFLDFEGVAPHAETSRGLFHGQDAGSYKVLSNGGMVALLDGDGAGASARLSTKGG